MNEKTRASRGATAGFSNEAVAACFERFSADPRSIQAQTVARRHGLSPSTAVLIAELAFGRPENWRAAR